MTHPIEKAVGDIADIIAAKNRRIITLELENKRLRKTLDMKVNHLVRLGVRPFRAGAEYPKREF